MPVCLIVSNLNCVFTTQIYYIIQYITVCWLMTQWKYFPVINFFSPNIPSTCIHNIKYVCAYPIHLHMCCLTFFHLCDKRCLSKTGVFSFNPVSCFLKYLQVCPFNTTSYLFTCILTEMRGTSLVIVVIDF